MIRVRKPSSPPPILAAGGKGRRERRRLCCAYTRCPDAYRDGTKGFEFRRSIYAHKTVKNALKRAQHGKCCFCESQITHIAHGDVEHFRPKAVYRQEPNGPLGRPGYYWLAYEWSNLFLACQLCNQRHKENLFPLRNPRKRALCHHDDVGQEQPLLINPAEVDPGEYILFRSEVPQGIDEDGIGEATIEALGLRRPELNERRWRRLKELKCLYETADLKPPVRVSQVAWALLKRSVQDSAEYSAMARAALASGFSAVRAVEHSPSSPGS